MPTAQACVVCGAPVLFLLVYIKGSMMSFLLPVHVMLNRNLMQTVFVFSMV